MSTTRTRAQAGFSMVEMLVVAVIMAIGLLGVASMQLISIKATSGSSNLTTAAEIANRVMDQVEEEGRLMWINQTATTFTTTGTEPPNLRYFAGGVPFTSAAQKYDLTGTPWTAASTTPAIFTATVKAVAAPLGVGTSTTGGLADVTVTVTFTDTVAQGNKVLSRNITVSRRIVYA